jgi:hypothetical protein
MGGKAAAEGRRSVEQQVLEVKKYLLIQIGVSKVILLMLHFEVPRLFL